MTIFVLHPHHYYLLSLEMAILYFGQTLQRRILPFLQKHDKTQRIRGIRQQSVNMLQRGIDQLFAVGWIHLERSGNGFELQERSPRAKVGIRIAEGRTVLSEVAIQGARKTFERHTEVLMKTLENHSWKGGLGELRLLLVRTHIAQKRRVPLQHAVDSSNEEIKLFIVETVIPIQLFQLLQMRTVDRVRVRPMNGGMRVLDGHMVAIGIVVNLGHPRRWNGELDWVAPHLPHQWRLQGLRQLLYATFFQYLTVPIPYRLHVLFRQGIDLETQCLHTVPNRFDDVRFALSPKVLQSILEVLIARSHRLSQPFVRLLCVPFDHLLTFDRSRGSFDNLFRRIAILGQLLSRIASVLWLHDFDWNVPYDFSVHLL